MVAQTYSRLMVKIILVLFLILGVCIGIYAPKNKKIADIKEKKQEVSSIPEPYLSLDSADNYKFRLDPETVTLFFTSKKNPGEINMKYNSPYEILLKPDLDADFSIIIRVYYRNKEISAEMRYNTGSGGETSQMKVSVEETKLNLFSFAFVFHGDVVDFYLDGKYIENTELHSKFRKDQCSQIFSDKFSNKYFMMFDELLDASQILMLHEKYTKMNDS